MIFLRIMFGAKFGIIVYASRIPPRPLGDLRLGGRGLGERGESMRSQETDFVCFGSPLGTILVSKSFQNPSQMEPKPPKIEFGKPFWLRVRPEAVLGVSWGGLGASRD
jgi:hypothetical protein